MSEKKQGTLAPVRGSRDPFAVLRQMTSEFDRAFEDWRSSRWPFFGRLASAEPPAWAPKIDVWVILQQGADALARGESFYTQVWTGSPGVKDHFTYLPWMGVLTAPGRWVAGDVRWAILLWSLVLFWGLWALARARAERAAAVVAVLATGGSYRSAVITSIIFGIISLSLVVVTGYCGQISLAQLTLAGVAGFLLSPMTDSWGIPFPIAPLLAALGAAVIGVLVGLPALRIRGLLVGVVTLTFALTVEASRRAGAR